MPETPPSAPMLILLKRRGGLCGVGPSIEQIACGNSDAYRTANVASSAVAAQSPGVPTAILPWYSSEVVG